MTSITLYHPGNAKVSETYSHSPADSVFPKYGDHCLKQVLFGSDGMIRILTEDGLTHDYSPGWLFVTHGPTPPEEPPTGSPLAVAASKIVVP